MKKRIKVRKGINRVFKPKWIDESKDLIIKLLIAIAAFFAITITICWGL